MRFAESRVARVVYPRLTNVHRFIFQITGQNRTLLDISTGIEEPAASPVARVVYPRSPFPRASLVQFTRQNRTILLAKSNESR
jgi:hypothetical protein